MNCVIIGGCLVVSLSHYQPYKTHRPTWDCAYKNGVSSDGREEISVGPLVCLSKDRSHFLALPGQINLFLLTKSLVLLH